MKTSRRILLILLVMSSCIGCDQYTKSIARSELGGEIAFSYFSGAIRLELFENSGVFLSLGSTLSPELRYAVFSLGVGIALLALLLYVLFANGWSRIELVALALILGGGFGNLVDRITRDGFVTDFLYVGLGPVQTGIFNVADMAISLGAFLLLVRAFLHRKA